MKYYFEAEEVLPDAATSPDLPEIIRLEVQDELEAIKLGKELKPRLSEKPFRVNFHTHDHLNGKPCQTKNLRDKIGLAPLPET